MEQTSKEQESGFFDIDEYIKDLKKTTHWGSGAVVQSTDMKNAAFVAYGHINKPVARKRSDLSSSKNN